MSIENIINTIDKEAESEAGRIITEAEEKADKIREEYSDRAKALSAKLKKESENKADEQYRRLIVNEQLELRKSLLSKKHEILEALYREAEKKIKEIPRKEYIEFMKELILKRTLSGSEEIIVSKEQRDLFDGDFIDSLNRAFPGGGNFTLSDSEADYSWGVVLKEDKRVIDLSIGVLFDQIAERVESQVAALLFPEGK
ncbi:MAG: V-type ATP synthase subunit E family protein [Candidatus Krumholzibacteriota bacterium]|nr:V-type ATP synthase subunit E family protein [Candidatus Krumholzibacteriota bacterium]